MQGYWYCIRMKRNTKNNKPKRDPKVFIRFLAIAILLMLIIDFVFWRDGRPYLYKDEVVTSDVPEIVEKIEEPVLVTPEEGDYFEAPVEDTSISKEDEDLIDFILGFGEGFQEESEVLLIPELPEAVQDLKADPPSEPVIVPSDKDEVSLENNNNNNKRGKIAIVIDDVGMNLKQSRAAIALPSEVTLAFLPYAEQVVSLSNQANEEGHEVIIHAPMEAMNSSVSLGPMALMSDMGYGEFKNEFNKIANSFEGYVGLNNHMGSKLTQSKEHMAYLMENLKKKNMYFLDSRTIHTSVAADMAKAYGVPSITRDVFLDHVETKEYTLNALKDVERIARENGFAVAIGHPKAITIEALEEWIPTLNAKGLELVKVSEIIPK